ncbi:right-handed parallel beta-helix repeat-containing protein [Kineococcus arenarius]|uniref:right-handed parallel beta-helix repeat-containing protein n=1 Tax=Kineococcus sp. SYSU DK007 TaxID=3383128 RepID=UPI003D7D9F0D
MPRTTRRIVAGALATGTAVLLAGAAPAAAADEPAPLPRTLTFTGDEAERLSALVAAEDRRATEIRTVTALARWQGDDWKTPYRMSTGEGFTLVLTPRSEPYTITDLLQLAPQTFVQMSDGSFLLSEHVAVVPGATLRLERPGGLTLRLASSARGFASIVGLGGDVQLDGEESAPVVVESWDVDAGEPDTDQTDGRAYVRCIGGSFSSEHARLSDLGFWSGRTGGLSLTGTDRPNTGAIERTGSGGDVQADSVLNGLTMQPAGPLQPGQTNPNLGYTVPAYDYVSFDISHTTIQGNAYGLFVTSANGIRVSDSTVTGSSIDGIVLHRNVRNGIVETTTATGNAGDGISLDRATSAVNVNGVTASGNEGNGISVNGRPLAEGPSATGASTSPYGRNSVTGSTFDGNGHYGIEVLGGFDIGIQNNRLSGNDMGIVVQGPAQRVSVTGNDVSRSVRHGIAFTDGVTDATATGNVVDGAATGVYVRASTARIRGNTVQGATGHGVSLVGDVEGSEVSLNVLAGAGASALDTTRSTGTFTERDNALDGWDDTSPWWFWFKKLLQPMTALWVIILVLIGASAVRGRGRDRAVAHPYAHQMAHQGHLPVPAPPSAPQRVIDLRDGRPSTRSGA